MCMVCGEQQYIFTAEGVRAHIEETHPGTLTLEEAECQRIREAWDEQVAVRERFFTNQLWQNSDALKGIDCAQYFLLLLEVICTSHITILVILFTEQSSSHTAEVEVVLGPDDKADQS